MEAASRKRMRLSALARGRPDVLAKQPRKPPPPRLELGLEHLIPGTEVATKSGVHWRHERMLPGIPGLAEAIQTLTPGVLAEAESEEVACLAGAGASGAVFLDLETCGFAGTPLFLTGMLRIVDGEAQLIQLLARDYAEEASVVEASLEVLAQHSLLITFNGKSYDLPFLIDRVVRFGFTSPKLQGHIDLLHAARRRWKTLLPDCRLQTLESRLTGVRRVHDVPGNEVPSRYHAFVQGGPAVDLVPVLRHNLQDLQTLVAILAALPNRSRLNLTPY